MFIAPGSLIMLTLSLTLATQPPATAPAAQHTETGFLYKTITLDGETYAYGVYVPPAYTPERPWPVILFLHGSGERGTDGFHQTEVGIGRAIRLHNDRVPAIVVMPQCRPGQSWVGDMGRMALKCVEAASHEYHCDPDRVYLTGLSLGGNGVWHIAASLPGRFAALVPICGFAELGQSTGLAEKMAPALVGTAIWAFHGGSDNTVPPEKSREMVNAIRALGSTVEYTEYLGMTHNVWDRAYNEAELWRWLFSQRRGTPPVSSQPSRP